eukprot:g2201.t1
MCKDEIKVRLVLHLSVASGGHTGLKYQVARRHDSRWKDVLLSTMFLREPLNYDVVVVAVAQWTSLRGRHRMSTSQGYLRPLYTLAARPPYRIAVYS